MAKQREISYRIVLRGRKGFAQLRSAKTFEIWYGRRRILAPMPFPSDIKRVGERRDLLSALIKTVERKRLEKLAKARKKRAKAREQKLRKEIERNNKRALRRQITKKPIKEDQAALDQVKGKTRELSEEQRRQLKSFDVAGKGLPVFPEAYAVQPYEWKNVRETDVMIIPVKPRGPEYKADLKEKMVETSAGKKYIFSHYNYTLKDEYLVPMTAETFREAYTRCTELFLPHILYFYENTKKSSDGYILRVKFAWSPEGEDVVLQGLSLTRQGLFKSEHVINMFRRTMLLFFGDKFTGHKFSTNYLQGEDPIFIRGFSMESSLLPD